MTVLRKKTCNNHHQNDNEIIEKQWIEYSTLYLKPPNISKKVLKELNDTLILKSYLLGNTRSSADSLIFQNLYQLMAKLTYKEKEQFVHLSRWYHNIQQDTKTTLAPITFSRLPLYQ